MAVTLKPIDQQVMVITGASSGIGLTTARAAAERGAKVVLAARSGDTIRQEAERINQNSALTGGQAVAVECDVGDRRQVMQLAAKAIETFGRIDTWVNNAGISIYGRLDEAGEEDSRKLMDTNFWGVYYGSLAALPHLKEGGGALINVGSEVSEAATPLLGMYVASKHAVKGFTDSLRIEVEEVDKSPVSITLIQPTAVNTPFPHHARNYMDVEPSLPTPRIEPADVADAILHAAMHPTRHTHVGTMSKINTAAAKLMPNMADRMAGKMEKQMRGVEAPVHPEGALYQSSEAIGLAGQTHGNGV